MGSCWTLECERNPPTAQLDRLVCSHLWGRTADKAELEICTAATRCAFCNLHSFNTLTFHTAHRADASSLSPCQKVSVAHLNFFQLDSSAIPRGFVETIQ